MTTLGPECRQNLIKQLSSIYLGPEEVFDLLLVGLLAPGHILLQGVPGVAKTTLAKSFSTALGCDFGRIQFTPDLLPADITGTTIYDLNAGQFEMRRGPIFAQVILGDEINRAPAKTQSALLEAMQEGQVTIDGQTIQLPEPFLVIATQNPVEQEGVYPLPEAQMDRFLLRIPIDYPCENDEVRMLTTHHRAPAKASAIFDGEHILNLRRHASDVHVSQEMAQYIVDVIRHTRTSRHTALGASPRAALALLKASKALAFLRGLDYVRPDEVRMLAEPVLAHRLILTPESQLDQFEERDVIAHAVSQMRYRGPAT